MSVCVCVCVADSLDQPGCDCTRLAVGAAQLAGLGIDMHVVVRAVN